MSKQMEVNNKRESIVKVKEPSKCWGCGEPHRLHDYPKNTRTIQNVQAVREPTTVNDNAWNIPSISVSLEDRQVEHQSTMTEIEGIIFDQTVSILIDTGENLSYISPDIVEMFNLKT